MGEKEQQAIAICQNVKTVYKKSWIVFYCCSTSAHFSSFLHLTLSSPTTYCNKTWNASILWQRGLTDNCQIGVDVRIEFFIWCFISSSKSIFIRMLRDQGVIESQIAPSRRKWQHWRRAPNVKRSSTNVTLHNTNNTWKSGLTCKFWTLELSRFERLVDFCPCSFARIRWSRCRMFCIAPSLGLRDQCCCRMWFGTTLGK